MIPYGYAGSKDTIVNNAEGLKWDRRWGRWIRKSKKSSGALPYQFILVYRNFQTYFCTQTDLLVPTRKQKAALTLEEVSLWPHIGLQCSPEGQ